MASRSSVGNLLAAGFYLCKIGSPFLYFCVGKTAVSVYRFFVLRRVQLSLQSE